MSSNDICTRNDQFITIALVIASPILVPAVGLFWLIMP